jgi:hypothetical protein
MLFWAYPTIGSRSNTVKAETLRVLICRFSLRVGLSDIIDQRNEVTNQMAG